MRRKNKKVNKPIDNQKVNNFIVRMMTGKSYDEFIEENTKDMFLYEKKEFIKNLNCVLKQMSRTISKEVFANV